MESGLHAGRCGGTTSLVRVGVVPACSTVPTARVLIAKSAGEECGDRDLAQCRHPGRASISADRARNGNPPARKSLCRHGRSVGL